MINFVFDMEPMRGSSISPFEMGDITLTDGITIITSKNKQPNQSMMIFISLSNLLDIFRKLVNSKAGIRRIFTGVDSSFELTIERNKDSFIMKNGNNIISESIESLVASIYKSAMCFYTAYSEDLENNNYYDLRDSLSDFKISVRK